MKINKLHNLLLALFMMLVAMQGAMAQSSESTQSGITFYKGSFGQALEEAKRQNKPLFVDFYAVWCVPCKHMAKEVFTQDSVGKYFNEKFISIQVDAEKPENKQVAAQYKVEAYPTLAFIGTDGKAISVTVGAMDAASLMEAAAQAAGDAVSFKELYEQYQKSPNNLELQKRILQMAPKFLMAQEGMNAEKWVVRVHKLYNSYIKAKMGEQLINRDDYLIITSMGGNDVEEQQKMADFINANLDAWQKVVGDVAAYYVIEFNDKRIETLAKEGNFAYKDAVAKVSGEYKPSYSVITFTSGFEPAKSSAKYGDAIYTIYKDKDVKKYVSLMSEYFDILGSNATPADYGRAAQNLYYAAGNKLKAEEHQLAITWITRALEAETSIVDRVNFLVMIGDSYTALKNYAEAQKYYRQGYAESLGLNDMEQVQAMVQATIVRKLSSLELLNK